jgi:hypothetical protein
VTDLCAAVGACFTGIELELLLALPVLGSSCPLLHGPLLSMLAAALMECEAPLMNG